jgi:Zn-dependent protease/CBS domain-containing protein
MNRRATIPLGRVFGIAIDVDYSWFLIFGLLTWTLAVGYYPQEFHGWPTYEYWLLGAITAIMLFASVVLHELGHSAVAIRYRVPVERITLFIFGGIAQIGTEPPSAGAEFWIAVAGPAVSLALAVLFWLLESVTSFFAPLFALCEYLAFINATLVVFNLIPGFPLDGGRVFRAIVWGITRNFRRATVAAASVGRLIGFAFIFFGVWLLFGGNFINGLWIAFIGWFLESAAGAQIIQVDYQALNGMIVTRKVSDVMNRNCPQVAADITVQEVVESHIFNSGERSFVVAAGDELAGLLTLHRIKDVPRSEWPTTTVRQAMIPAAQVKRIEPDANIWNALREMDSDGVNQLPVMTNGHVVGMLTREGVISFLRTMEELQS